MKECSKKGFDNYWNRIILPAIYVCLAEMDQDFCDETDGIHKNEREYKKELESIFKEKSDWLDCEYLIEENNAALDCYRLGSILCRCIIGCKLMSFDIKVAESIQRTKWKEHKEQRDLMTAWEIDNLYVNYKLAFLVGAGLAYHSLLFWAQNLINQYNSDIAKIRKQMQDTTEESENGEGENRDEDKAQCEDEDEEQNKEIEELNAAECRIKKALEIITHFKDILIGEGKLRSYDTTKRYDDFSSELIVSMMKTDCLSRDFDYLMFATILFQWQEYTKQCILLECKNEYVNLNYIPNLP